MWLDEARHGRDKAWGAEKSNAEKDQTEAEVAFDRPWMCRARRERSQ
jgi:hypothetical protein